MCMKCLCGCGEKLRKDNKTGYQKCHKQCAICNNFVKRSDTECCSKKCSAKLHWKRHPEMKNNRVWNKSRNDVRRKNPNWKISCSNAAIKSYQNGKISWSKGKTKNDNDSLKKLSIVLLEGYKSGRIKPSFLGKKHKFGWYESIIKICKEKYGVENPGSLAFKNNLSISNFELSFRDKFLKEGYEHSVPIGKFIVDYLNKKTNHIIEIYGDYWHCNPTKYDKNFYNKSVRLYAKDVWKKDAKRIKDLEKMGYSVRIIWENKNANT